MTRFESELSSWLSGTWLSDGPAVAVLAGFSGLGKSDIAYEVAEKSQRPWAFENLISDNLTLDEITLNVAESLEACGSNTMADLLGSDFVTTFVKSLEEPILIVLDDFHELLDEQGLPPREFRTLIHRLCTARPAPAGRLLLVTNRAVTQESWLDQAHVRRVEPPAEDHAVSLLASLLAQQDLEDEVPSERRGDVVRWLGRNPRAIQALVACLSNDSLDDLIELDRDSWGVRDEVVGPELVRHLEERFLDRTLQRISPEALALVESLSVYRKTFTKEAIQGAGAGIVGNSDVEDARRELSSRFLLERRRNWFTLNPIARELARARILMDERKLRRSHARAAEYYSRHFRARNSASRMDKASEFVEARFHLLRLGQREEFDEIARGFRAQLLLVYRNIESLPKDVSAQRELLATLWAALEGEEGGSWSLRFCFARLLLARDEPDDALVAYRQITIASRESNHHDVWILRCRLAVRFEEPAITRTIISQARERLSAGVLLQVVRVTAVALTQMGHPADALRLLEDVQQYCLQTGDAWLLYHTASVILCSQDRHKDAIAFLLKGYETLGPQRERSGRLVEESAFLAFAARDAALLGRIQQVVVGSQGRHGWVSLCEVLKLQTERKFKESADLAAAFPEYLALKAQRAFSLLCLGRASEAKSVLTGSIPVRNLETGLGWLRAVACVAAGDVPEGDGTSPESAWLAEFAAAHGMAPDEVTAESLLRHWDTFTELFGGRVSFYFPWLPRELTGLDQDLIRLSSTTSALDGVDLSRLRFRNEEGPRPPAAGAVPAVAGAPLVGVPPQPGWPTIFVTTQGGPAVLPNGGTLDMGGNYNVNQAGAVGDGAQATGNTFNQVVAGKTEDLQQLSAELQRLTGQLRLQGEAGQHAQELGELEGAAAAAASGDVSGVRAHLRRSGQWALGAATSVGTALAAAWIRESVGM
ncbi:hypothetical protein [Streptomyces asoensis]|uniref:hypothetical protein n=1 Tax=Streptomyces asoensis TaxID=249586 RepID=UPI0033D5F3B8